MSAVNNIPPGYSVRIDAEGTSVPTTRLKAPQALLDSTPYVDGEFKPLGFAKN